MKPSVSRTLRGPLNDRGIYPDIPNFSSNSMGPALQAAQWMTCTCGSGAVYAVATGGYECIFGDHDDRKRLKCFAFCIVRTVKEDLHLKGALQQLQALAWLSGTHTGGSSERRSPSPSSSVLSDTCAGGALGTSETPPSSSSALSFICMAGDAS